MRPITTGLLIALLLLQGCGAPGPHSHGGQLVAEYPARRKPAFGWTRIPAVYVLYSQGDRPEGQPTATKANVGWKLTAVQLEKHSPLGFKEVNGGVVAVAGGNEIPLPPGLYCWHTRPNSEPVDWGKTLIAAGLIGAAVFGVIAVVAVVMYQNSLDES